MKTQICKGARISMIRSLIMIGLLLAGAARVALADVLIVADEFPAMEVLAAKLKTEEHVLSKLVTQKEMPASLAPFETVVVYIHGALSQYAEDAFIDYTTTGGK